MMPRTVSWLSSSAPLASTSNSSRPLPMFRGTLRAPLMAPSPLAAVTRLLQPDPLSVTSSGVAGASLMVVDSVRTGDIVVPGFVLFPASPMRVRSGRLARAETVSIHDT